MSKLEYGDATYNLPAKLNKAWPEEAGKLTLEQMQQLSKARRGLGLTCAQVADALRKVGDGITLDKELTPDAIEEAGERAEAADLVVQDLERLLANAKQGNLLLDAAAHDMLRRVNDAVRTQSKFKPELASAFPALSAYFRNK